MGLFVIIIVFMIASLVVSTRLKNKFKKYSKIPLSTGLTGKEIAQLMLADHGINDCERHLRTGTAHGSLQSSQ